MNINSLTIEQQELLKDALYEYDGLDYYDKDLKVLFSDGIIPLAYTTVGDNNQYEIQVNFNLNKMRYEEYINNELFFSPNEVYERTFKDFIDELRNTTFDEMIHTLYSECNDREDIEYKYNHLNNVVGNDEYLRALWYIKNNNVSIDDVIDAKGNYQKKKIDEYYMTHTEPSIDTWSSYLTTLNTDTSGLQAFLDSLDKSKDPKENTKDSTKGMNK